MHAAQQPGDDDGASPGLRRVAMALCAVGVGAGMAQTALGQNDLPDTDFAQDAGAARILLSGSRCIYCVTSQHDALQSWLGMPLPAGQPPPSLHPPLAALFTVPFAALPPHVALGAFTAVSILAIAIAVALLGRHAPVALPRQLCWVIAAATALCVPATWALALGQVDPLLLLCAAAGMVALRSHRPEVAGLLLSALALKPHLVWLVVVVALLTRQWRLSAGLAAGGAIWLVSALAILGPGHAGDWVSATLHNASGETTPMLGLPGLVRSLVGVQSGVTYVAAAGFMVVTVLLAGWQRERLRRRPTDAVALAIAVSLMVSPHVWAHDLMLLAVPLLLIPACVPRLALQSAAAFDIAYLLDRPLPHPHAPAQTVVLVTVVCLAVVGVLRPRQTTSGRSAMSACRSQPDPR